MNTPSQLAIDDQFDARYYPGIDNWQDCNLHNGNIIYIWEADGQKSHGADGSAYAMTPDTALGCNGDPNRLQDSLQTSLPDTYDFHRGHLQAYEAKGEIPAAFSHCEANKCYGSGGGEQYYIPNFDGHVSNENMTRRDDLSIDFNKDMLPISPEHKAEHADSLKNQSAEATPTSSQGTSPSLDGAYKGETPRQSK